MKFKRKHLFTAEKFRTSNVKIYSIFTALSTCIIASPFHDFTTMGPLGTTRHAAV